MNREIRFRAWDAEKKEMYTPSVLSFSENKVLSLIKCDDGNRKYIEHELMQFTGLYDKNGTPIFEGDYVERGGKVYEIKWNNLHACWGLFNNSGQSSEEILCDITDNYGNPPKDWRDSTLLVIGNIFEAIKELSHETAE